MFSRLRAVSNFPIIEAKKIIEYISSGSDTEVPEGFDYTPPEHYDTFDARIKGVTIHYAKTGNGPSVVLLHGLTNNWFGWGRLIQELERDYTLYVLDLPGYGDSGDLLLKHYSVEQQAEYVAVFIKQVVPDKPIVVGLSMGSLITAEVGNITRDQLRAIVLMGPVFNSGRTSVLTTLLRYELQLIQLSDKAQSVLKRLVASRWFGYAANKYLHMHEFKRYLSDLYGLVGRQKMRKKVFIDMGISVAKYELNPVLEQLNLPILLIYGKYDKVSRPEQIAELPLMAKDNIQLNVIDNAGHVVSVEQPHEVAQSIRGFLKKSN